MHAQMLLNFVQIWSDGLSSVAQTYSEKCNFAYNANRTSQQSTFSSVGENLFASSASNVEYSDAVQAWYDEVSDYDYVANSCFGVCGHYTQVMPCELL